MECQSRNICGRRAGVGYFLQSKPIPWELGTRESGFRQQAEGVPKHRSAWADRRVPDKSARYSRRLYLEDQLEKIATCCPIDFRRTTKEKT